MCFQCDLLSGFECSMQACDSLRPLKKTLKGNISTWQPTVFLCSLLLFSRLLSGLMLRRVRPPVPGTWPVGLVAFSPSRNSSTSRSNWEQQSTHSQTEQLVSALDTAVNTDLLRNILRNIIKLSVFMS